MEIIHIQFETLLSTNVYAKEHIASYSRENLTIISTREQSGGRGQYGRHWHSPPGNIYASFCFFTQQEKDPFFWTRTMAETIQALLNQWHVEATLKWPNDLLVNGKKIVGILTETVPFEQEIGVVIGVGFNVNLSQELVEKIDQPATSLAIETHLHFDEKAVLEDLIRAFHEHL